MINPRSEIRWPRRVKKHEIRRLYESDAKGLLDEQLVDEVGVALLLRCKAILEIAAARRGTVRCHRCANRQLDTTFRRPHGLDTPMTCPVCGWSLSWKEYYRTIQRRQLNSGGAVPAFVTYVESFPRAKTPQEKWRLIDRLIHEFHYSMRDRPDFATRSVGPNLIEGKLYDVIAFLTELSNAASGETRETFEQWNRTYRAGYWPEVFQKEGRDT